MKKSICLNMIVKNESQVIERCLASVSPVIDYWVIVDTGSTDGTQKIIRKFLQGVPGELHERPWVDFAHNRNEAMLLAKNHGDYLLFIDADDTLEVDSSVDFNDLENDLYTVCWRLSDQGLARRTLLVNNHLNWSWEGPVHERIVCSDNVKVSFLPGVAIFEGLDGHQSKDVQKKNLAYAKILEEAVRKDPENTQLVFNLALSYDQAKEFLLAIESYEKRTAMGQNSLEVFASQYRIGCLQKKLNRPSSHFITSFSLAYLLRPTRPEPLYCLADYFIENKCYFLSYLLSRYALDSPMQNDFFFSKPEVYEYLLLWQLAECAFRIGQLQESQHACQLLLKIPALPAELRSCVEQNLAKLESFKSCKKWEKSLKLNS